MNKVSNEDLGEVISDNCEAIQDLKDRISRLEKFVLLAIVTNLPQLLEIFQV